MREVRLTVAAPETKRLYEFARLLGVTSTQLREYLNLLGVPAQSASSKITLDPLFMESLHARFMKEGAQR